MAALPETVAACRDLLDRLTPLTSDCGAVCGAACCRTLEGDETGMLLFPGEDAYYQERPGYRIKPSALGALLICDGHCAREDRPLSCRLFPLLPVLRGEEIKVAVDLRARAVCPLARHGVRAMQGEMIEAVRACGRLLQADPAQHPFLQRLTDQQDELKALMNIFGGR